MSEESDPDVSGDRMEKSEVARSAAALGSANRLISIPHGGVCACMRVCECVWVRGGECVCVYACVRARQDRLSSYHDPQHQRFVAEQLGEGWPSRSTVALNAFPLHRRWKLDQYGPDSTCHYLSHLNRKKKELEQSRNKWQMDGKYISYLRKPESPCYDFVGMFWWIADEKTSDITRSLQTHCSIEIQRFFIICWEMLHGSYLAVVLLIIKYNLCFISKC